MPGVWQGYARAEGLRTVRDVGGRRTIVETATTPLVRAAAALQPVPSSGGGGDGGLDSGRLLRVMLQHLMTELNGSYTSEGPEVRS